MASSTRGSRDPAPHELALDPVGLSSGLEPTATPKWASSSPLMPVIDGGGSPRPTVSIGTSESAVASDPWLPPPTWLRPARSANSQPGAAETITSPAFGLRSAPSARARPSRYSSRSARSSSPSRRATTSPSSRKSARSTAGSPSSASASFARVVAVEHRGAVRRGDERTGDLEPRGLLDRRLAVVGAEDDARSVEELVGAAGRVEERRDRRVGAAERLVRGVRPERVRGVVVVRQVVDEQVEAVARDEPAPDRRGVGVDRAERAVEPRDRRAGPVGLVDAVEEEALRPVDGREAGDRREVPVAAAVGRDVDRRRREARVLERLVDRLGAPQQMALVQVDDRVAHPLHEPGGAKRGERRAVLDEPLLLAVPPDEVGDPVHVGVAAGRDRGEADRRQRRERRGRAAVAAVVEQEAERGRLGRLEHRRRQAVDHDQDDGSSRCGSSVTRERAQARRGVRARDAHRTASSGHRRSRSRYADDRDERECRRCRARPARRSPPGRAACRRAERARDDRRRSQAAGEPADDAADRLGPAEERRTRSPRRAIAADRRGEDRLGKIAAARMPDRDAEARDHADPVPAPIAASVLPRAARAGPSGPIGDDPGRCTRSRFCGRLPRYPLEVFFWTPPADLGRDACSPTSSSRRSTPSRCTPRTGPRTSSSTTSAGRSTSGAAGTAAGSSGSRSTATPTRATRPRSSRSTRCSSGSSAGSCSATTCWPAC